MRTMFRLHIPFLVISALILMTPMSSAQFTSETKIAMGAAGDLAGFSVSRAGDVNNDGVGDFIVGAFGADVNGIESGSATVYSGKDQSVLYTFHGNAAGDFFGFSVSDAGDVNGDGYGDVIIGAFGTDTNGPDSGSARIHSGLDGSVLFSFFGGAAGDELGRSVSGAGDTNNDGFADVVIGSPTASNGPLSETGRATIFSGLTGNSLFVSYGDISQAQYGVCVSGAGDVNGDGFDDVIVGADTDNDLGTDSGSASVISGADGSVLYALAEGNPFDHFGISVSEAGDLDQDGYDDFIVGASGYDGNFSDAVANQGRVLVFSGVDGSIMYSRIGHLAGSELGNSVDSISDYDGDGFDDFIVGAHASNGASGVARVYSGRSGGYITSEWGEDLGNHFGFAVAGINDMNGDGLADFLVGVPFAGQGGSNAGFVRIFAPRRLKPLLPSSSEARFGKSMSKAGDVNGDGFADFVVGSPSYSWGVGRAHVISGQDGSTITTYFGTDPSGSFGFSVSGAGDLNSDGYADVVIGAPLDNTGAPAGGRVYVYSGFDGSVLYDWKSTVSSARYGWVVSGAGDFDGDGFRDILIGAPFDSTNGPLAGSVEIRSGFDGSVLGSQMGNTNDQLGLSLSYIGDVNGDGNDEIIVGSPESSPGGMPAAGIAQVYAGSPNGGLNSGGLLWTFSGTQPHGLFGKTVSEAGDVNSDGFGDFMVASPRWYGGYQISGRVVVYSGKDGSVLYDLMSDLANHYIGEALSACGDLNRDGFDDFAISTYRIAFSFGLNGGIAVFSGIDGQPIGFLHSHGGNGADASIIAAGDVNQDGFGDLAIGAPRFGGHGAVTFYLSDTLPVGQFSSVMGITKLMQSWAPDGNDPYATTGTLSCTGANPGALGIVAMSLAPSNSLVLGFPLLIANDPANLVLVSNFGFGFQGEIAIGNVSRQSPNLAGSRVYIQFFESSPEPSSSNALSMLIVP